MGDRMGQALPPGFTWEPCKRCGLPTVLSETGSVYGGRIAHGCVRCVLKVADERGVRDQITEGVRALDAAKPSEGKGDGS